jgi:uncharacterized alpha-E superfamily protein
MLSRVADSLYWLGRYVERAENIARFADVSQLLGLDASPDAAAALWLPLVETTGDTEWFTKKYKTANADTVMKFLIADNDYSNSIVSCLRAARENARAIREIISSEMWEQINTFHLMARDAGERMEAGESPPPSFLTAVKQQSHLFSGITADTMTHNEAWYFIRLGRMMERADKTSRILDVKYYFLLPSVHDVGSILDESQWSAVLRSASAFEMYRKAHGRIEPSRIVEFLVLDAQFPRAIRRCVVEAERSLREIAGPYQAGPPDAAIQAIGRLRASLDYSSSAEILKTGLHEFLDQCQKRLNEAGEALRNLYFTNEPLPQEPSA